MLRCTFVLAIYIVLTVGLPDLSVASPNGPVPSTVTFVTSYAAPWLTGGGAMTIGPDKNLWVAGNQTIARVTLSGSMTTFAAHDNGLSISAGPNNSVWFSPSSGGIGRVSMKGRVTYYRLATGNNAWNVTKGPDGNEWFSDPDGFAIGKITPQGVVTEYTDPLGTSPDSMISSGNLIWFIDQGDTGSASSTTDGRITEYTWGVPCFTNYDVIAATDQGSILSAGYCIVRRQYAAVLGIPNGEWPVHDSPYALSRVNEREVWGLTARGLFRFNLQSGRWSTTQLPSQFSSPLGVLHIRNGYIWVGVAEPPSLLLFKEGSL